MNGWSPQWDQHISDMWQRGCSAAEISQSLLNVGIVKTRNAVIGRLHRIGMNDRTRLEPSLHPKNTVARSQVTFTAEMDAALRKMAGEGISRATASRRMGVSETRIRDRIGRLNLLWTEPKSAASNPWSKPASGKKRADAERWEATRLGQALLANATDDAGPEAVPLINRRTFGQCAWPVGDATGAAQLCCGKRIPNGAAGVRQSYCEGHGMRAVSKTFTREPAVRQDRTVAAAPRRTPESDGLWDMAA